MCRMMNIRKSFRDILIKFINIKKQWRLEGIRQKNYLLKSHMKKLIEYLNISLVKLLPREIIAAQIISFNSRKVYTNYYF